MSLNRGTFKGVAVSIKECITKSEIRDFINLPFSLYKTDPFFTPRLKRDQRVLFSLKNPFYSHSKVRLYIALKNNIPLGRVASIINYNHLDYHRDFTGFFGFFESIEDADVASALLAKVARDLKAEGMQRLLGPMSFSTNEECGLLVEGFQEPPMIMMPYNPAYYDRLMLSIGLTKARDLYAYIYELQDSLPEKVYRVANICEKRGLRVRSISKRHFFRDMKMFQYVYNKAWATNWCFVPISDEELQFTAKELKMILREDTVAIAESEGQPVGFLGVIPNFNIVLRKMRGTLNPLSLAKALYYSREIHEGRLLLFGIVPEYRNKGVDALLFREVHRGLIKAAFKRVEFSWILEDNGATIKIAELFGGILYKRYRIYEKRI